MSGRERDEQGMVSVLELVVVAGMSVFLLGVMITLFGIASRTYGNTVSYSDARREVHSTLDGVVSELRNARGVARCLDTYESGEAVADSSECRRVEESPWAINEVAVDGWRFCFFTYELDADAVADERFLKAPGPLCVEAVDTDASDPEAPYRLELQRWPSASDDYFAFASDADSAGWLVTAKAAFTTDPPRELVGYAAKQVDRGGGVEAVDPFTFRNGDGDAIDPVTLDTADALAEIRTVEIDLAVAYAYRRGETVAIQKFFTFKTTVALRGAVYEAEQAWDAIG